MNSKWQPPETLSLEAPPVRSPAGRQQGAPGHAGVDSRHLATHLCGARLWPPLPRNDRLPAATATSAAGAHAIVGEFLFTVICAGKNR